MGVTGQGPKNEHATGILRGHIGDARDLRLLFRVAAVPIFYNPGSLFSTGAEHLQ
jgi:hypothetical protein